MMSWMSDVRITLCLDFPPLSPLSINIRAIRMIVRPSMTMLTVDVILSLVRTKGLGYLRHIRRWVVALSRARLGLYVVGRRRLFEMSAELEPMWSKLIANGDKL